MQFMLPAQLHNTREMIVFCVTFIDLISTETILRPRLAERCNKTACIHDDLHDYMYQIHKVLSSTKHDEINHLYSFQESFKQQSK